MDRAEIVSELRALVLKARSPSGDADPATVDDIIDSLEGVEAIMAAEERFGISIPDADLNRVCRSIPAIAEVVELKLRNQAKGAEA